MKNALALAPFALVLPQGTPPSPTGWVQFTNVSGTHLVSDPLQPPLSSLGRIGSADERASCFVVGDFDGDGLEDVGVFCKTPGFGGAGGAPVPHVLLMNAGGGVLVDETLDLAPDFNAHPSHVREATAVDIDLDGDLDIVAANTNDEDPFLFVNDGHDENGWIGLRWEETWYLTEEGHTKFTLDSGGGLNSSSVAAGDVDGDGDPDLVFGCYVASEGDGQDGDKLLENLGDGRFVERTSTALVAGVPNNLVMKTDLVDMDLDGDLDIVMTNAFQNFCITYNQGLHSGVFAEASLITAAAPGFYDHALADFDGDGRIDAYSTGDWPYDVTTLNDGLEPGTGGVLWTPAAEVHAIPDSTGTDLLGGNTHAYDFDADGIPDVAVADMITYGPFPEQCNDGATTPFIMLRGRPTDGSVSAVFDPNGTLYQPVRMDGVWDFAFFDGYLITACCKGLRLFQRN